MTTQTVKTLDKQESDEILGIAYFDTICNALGWDKKVFLLKFNTYLFTGKVDFENEKPLFDMLIELSSLTLSLYKWSVLLVNLKASIFADMLFTLVIDGKHYYITEEQGALLLRDLKNDKVLYQIDTLAKSQSVAILLYLYNLEDIKIDMVELETYQEKFSGSYLSFNQELALEKKDYINFIDTEFQKYHTRLKDLQKIFLENFTQ